MTEILQKRRPAEVIPLRPVVAPAKVLEVKRCRFGTDQGFCAVSSMLLRTQARLGLNLAQLAVLLHLVDYWWATGLKSYPSKRRFAARLKLGPRQLQRYVAELEKAGFVQRVERRATNRSKLSNEYDLSGLVARLAAIEPEFRLVPTVKAPVRAGGRHGIA